MAHKFQQWHWYVYIAKRLDDTFYTGLTLDPSIRDEQHKSGHGGEYTKRHGYVANLYLEEFEDFEMALARERQIKGWTRKKKEILIKGEWKQDRAPRSRR